MSNSNRPKVSGDTSSVQIRHPKPSNQADPSIPAELPVLPDIADDLPIQFADGMLVTHTEHEFILSFSQVQHLPLTGEQLLALIKRHPERQVVIKNKYIARFAIPATRMAEFIAALQTNHEKYLAHQETHRDNVNIGA